MNSMSTDDFLNQSMRLRIKKIVANICDSDGHSNCAFEITYDIMLRSYDLSCTTLDDIILFLESIKHYDKELEMLLDLRQNLQKLNMNISDVRWAHTVMLEQGWSHEEICAMWPQIEFELVT